MTNQTLALFIVLAAIVLGLSIYLGILYSKLRARNKDLIEARRLAEEAIRERRRDIERSLETLALVIIQEQCDPTEGCIRVKKLIDEIEDLSDRPELSVFHEMYDEVKHFAIKEEYRNLSKQEAFKQDNLRFKIEEKYLDDLKEASERLRTILGK